MVDGRYCDVDGDRTRGTIARLEWRVYRSTRQQSMRTMDGIRSRTSNYKHILSILIWVITDSSKTTESIRDLAKGRNRFFYALGNITFLLGGGRDFACIGAAQCSRGICSYQHCYSLALAGIRNNLLIDS